MNKVQKLQLELMRHASFNSFDGDNVADDLEANSELWRGAVMTRVGDLIYLRDIEHDCWNVDTLYILPAEGQDDELEKFALRHWSADSVEWIDEERAHMLLGAYPSGKILEIWWD